MAPVQRSHRRREPERAVERDPNPPEVLNGVKDFRLHKLHKMKPQMNTSSRAATKNKRPRTHLCQVWISALRLSCACSRLKPELRTSPQRARRSSLGAHASSVLGVSNSPHASVFTTSFHDPA